MAAFEAEKELLEQVAQRQLNEFDPDYIKIDKKRVIVGGQIALSLRLGNSIIVLEDKYKDPNACDICQDTKIAKMDCEKCDGKGKNRFGEDCTKCNGKGFEQARCQFCLNKIIIPDQAKARPTSGIIQVIGPEVTGYEVGDRVAYSGYTGHLLPFKGNTRIRIMKETEAFCLVENISGVTPTIEFIDKDTAYDLT